MTWVIFNSIGRIVISVRSHTWLPRAKAADTKGANSTPDERGCWPLKYNLYSVEFGRTNRRMEYRGVRYTIRVGIEPDLWSVTIHPGGVESAAKKVRGTRETAESHARSMINKWLQNQSATHRGHSTLNMTARHAERKQLDE